MIHRTAFKKSAVGSRQSANDFRHQSKPIANRTRFAMVMAIIVLLSPIVVMKAFSLSPEKRASSIQLSFYKKYDLSKTAVASVKGKNIEGKFFPIRNIKVGFYIQDKSEKKFLKSTITDVAGKATISLPKEMPIDENHYFTIISKIENDSVYEDAEEQIHFKDAGFNLSLDPSDSSHLVTATLMEIGKDGMEMPVKNVEIKFYTQRLFGVMPAMEEYSVSTDENGKAEFSYPGDMKGDEAGHVLVVARIEDNESYGNIESKAGTKWGIPVVVEKNPFPRALWEPTAPYPLIITIAVLFGGVWSTYCFVFYQMRRIKKDGELEVRKT